MILGITGHRPHLLGGFDLPNPTYKKVCQELENKFLELKPTKIITGMALGCDQWAAFIAYKLKIPFIAAIPFEEQDSNWLLESKKTYQKLLKQASEIVIVSPGEYSIAKMQIRNQWIVDHCDILLAVFNGSREPSGTRNCIDYANLKNKKNYFN